MSDVSKILSALEQGDTFAAERLFPLVYDELRQMAQGKLNLEKAVDSLQATALVHEAYIRLVDGQAGASYKNRRYFFGAAGEAMRRILVDRARKKGSLKHGGDRSRVELFDIGTMPDDQELLALDEALRRLAEEDALAAEVVNLKFFAGISREAIAEMTGLTIHEVRLKWSYARAWLQVAINQGSR